LKKLLGLNGKRLKNFPYPYKDINAGGGAAFLRGVPVRRLVALAPFGGCQFFGALRLTPCAFLPFLLDFVCFFCYTGYSVYFGGSRGSFLPLFSFGWLWLGWLFWFSWLAPCGFIFGSLPSRPFFGAVLCGLRGRG